MTFAPTFELNSSGSRRLAAACRRWGSAALLGLAALHAQASVGLTETVPTALDGPVTVFYPASAAAATVRRGPFAFTLAEGSAPVRGNGRLVVISHGSGGSPWVHADLARTLVDAGFVVALPEHRGDNYRHDDTPGPASWVQRPAEVSRAIDAIGRDPRFAPLLELGHVGMYGMSAGGHTALVLAGGRWSDAGFAQHCEAHIAEDFQTCVGLVSRLGGSPFDAIRKSIALAVIRHRFGDTAPHAHTDPRIADIVAGVPLAADFDMASLAAPAVPLGLVTAAQDRWLVPRFHGERVLQACARCERVAAFPGGGHGALLSPLPPGLTGLLGDMLNDPPGFDRDTTAAVERAITAFFLRHLLPG